MILKKQKVDCNSRSFKRSLWITANPKVHTLNPAKGGGVSMRVGMDKRGGLEFFKVATEKFVQQTGSN
ncbi:MAG: hypothetical protein IPL22_21405 [Bacteroidetes bacterium]|nr:hypothetical protein [Bacteroidota bacterium]